MMPMLSQTQSLCPECLSRIPAYYIKEGDAVFLVKHCDSHGKFQTVLWRGKPDFETWVRPKIPTSPSLCYAEMSQGCPFDCGLCPEHRQHTCTALLEITMRCNLNCPVCFASAGSVVPPDPDLKLIRTWYERVMNACGFCNIQLSGGEPTVRDDLPMIIEIGREIGFSFIQLNTNGIRLATEKDYARRLKEAGLSSVFLQFDGTNDDIYIPLRGKPLFEVKQAAIEHCAENDIGVVLVPTLMPKVNLHNIGDILRFGLKFAPTVRGVHFQPVSYFGRYPNPPLDKDRITLPEIMTAIEQQTEGMVRTENFRPPGCENARCSFHGNFILMPDKSLKALTQLTQTACQCSESSRISQHIEEAEEGAIQAISTVARQWAFPTISEKQCCEKTDDLDAFLTRARQYGFAVSAMAFQDAWNLDTERLRDCCIHVVSPEGKLIPFCIYNLTSAGGKSLYRLKF
jgi:uncharacterized radical SAM superfamily Fe-S cluster-containing enzyme